MLERGFMGTDRRSAWPREDQESRNLRQRSLSRSGRGTDGIPALIRSAQSSHSETGILEGTLVKVAEGDTVTIPEYPFRSRRNLPELGNPVSAHGF